MTVATALRLLADDLTGTLDTAAAFTGLCGPIRAVWPPLHGPLPIRDLPSNLAIDSGTREWSAPAAAGLVAGLAQPLREAGLAYRKLDSLLRGPWAEELAACIAVGGWRYVVVAPAFPFQGRQTWGSCQFAASDTGWIQVSGAITETLKRAGLDARRALVADGLVEGVAVYDAETDADLDRIAALAARTDQAILWCGSGGLAAALARHAPAVTDAGLAGPVLGLFGSDRPETAAQLGACDPHRLVLSADAPARAVAGHLAETGLALVSLDLPAGTERGLAAARIAAAFARIADAVPPPGTLLVAGGETLKALCLALGTHALDVTGQVMPGVPRSRMVGGRWDGVAVVSKSGAFGSSSLWRDLLRDNGFKLERSDT